MPGTRCCGALCVQYLVAQRTVPCNSCCLTRIHTEGVSGTDEVRGTGGCGLLCVRLLVARMTVPRNSCCLMRIHAEGVSGPGEVGYLHYLQMKTCEEGCSPHSSLCRFVVS